MPCGRSRWSRPTGRLVRASDDENADLFWGMRGAGPNFGIVTALEFELWPVGPVITRGILIHPPERAREVASAFDDFMAGAPDDVMASLFMGRATPVEDYPASIAGKPIIAISVTYAGPPSDAARVLKPLTDIGEPVSGSLRQQTHLESQHANDAGMDWGHRVYTKSGFLGSLPASLVDALMAHAERGMGDDIFSIWTFGGAVGRVPDDAMAFTGRRARYWIGAETVWDDAAEDAAHIGWARDGIALIAAAPHHGRLRQRRRRDRGRRRRAGRLRRRQVRTPRRHQAQPGIPTTSSASTRTSDPEARCAAPHDTVCDQL